MMWFYVSNTRNDIVQYITTNDKNEYLTSQDESIVPVVTIV